MSARLTALVAGFVAIALVLAQDVAPGAAFYHSWQYALALAVALALMAGYAAGAWRGHDGPVGRRLVLALAGLAVVDLAGLASGLLGPDTATIVGTPGTVAPIPVLGAAAFFAPADADALARGAGSVVLRRRGHSAIELGVGTRRLLGDSVVSLTPRPALYVEAWDARGAHLTVTQPAGTAFLSPVLQFGTRQRITRRAANSASNSPNAPRSPDTTVAAGPFTAATDNTPPHRTKISRTAPSGITTDTIPARAFKPDNARERTTTTRAASSNDNTPATVAAAISPCE